MAANKKDPAFYILLLGIIFDPKKRKILIGRKEEDPEIPGFTWGFPGTELHYGQNPTEALTEKLKEKTGYEVENLGAVFSKVYPENKSLMAIYYLCEATSGNLKVGGFFKEMQWVKPEEIEKKVTTSFHPRLKEYILNLK